MMTRKRSCARHVAHDLSSTLPACPPTIASSPPPTTSSTLGMRDPRSFPAATSGTSRHTSFTYAGQFDAEPQPPYGTGRGHGRHQDRVHRRSSGFNLLELGQPQRPLAGLGRGRRQDPARPRSHHGRSSSPRRSTTARPRRTAPMVAENTAISSSTRPRRSRWSQHVGDACPAGRRPSTRRRPKSGRPSPNQRAAGSRRPRPRRAAAGRDRQKPKTLLRRTRPAEPEARAAAASAVVPLAPAPRRRRSRSPCSKRREGAAAPASAPSPPRPLRLECAACHPSETCSPPPRSASARVAPSARGSTARRSRYEGAVHGDAVLAARPPRGGGRRARADLMKPIKLASLESDAFRSRSGRPVGARRRDRSRSAPPTTSAKANDLIARAKGQNAWRALRSSFVHREGPEGQEHDCLPRPLRRPRPGRRRTASARALKHAGFVLLHDEELTSFT